MNIEEKATYCLSCKNKNCMKGCPLSNDITDTIKFVKEEDYTKAFEKITQTTILSSICGRICPHTKQCQGSCVRGIRGESVEIGEIEAFVGDYGLDNNIEIKNLSEYKELDKSVAVIGSGPCGITCAATLKRLGINKVDLYEKKSYLGGLLVHGIPEFRLPKSIVKKVYEKIINLGIDVKNNMELGKNIDLEDLKSKYDAVFIAIGANKSSKMNIDGEGLIGVYGGNELLEYKNYPDFNGKSVAVIGGGNVAMDASRTIKKLGADHVYVIYRRAEEQMPAEKKEIKDAKAEGIEFRFLNNIVKILGKDKVEKIECIKTELIYEEGKRPYPVNIENSNYTLDMDYVVMAIGSCLEKNVMDGLEKNEWGKIKIDENYRTNIENVYAAGDAAGIKSTVAWASCSGREAAKKIYNDLKEKNK
ncbi:MAG: FAD-dependent oxidoreductase [Clostridia bacterium]